MQQVERIFDLLPYGLEKFGTDHLVLAGKEDGKWIEYTQEQFIEYVRDISSGLIELGVEPGQKIATISNNRPEWNFLDMAIMQIGAVHVPIYPTISQADYEYILNHAEVQYVFVAGWELFRKIEHIIPNISSLKDIYTFRELRNYKHLNELIQLGRDHPHEDKIKRRRENITKDQCATLIYTSGTTGNPKGVMLSHDNLISNFKAVSWIPPIGPESRALSYLPLCHVYERMLNYMYQYKGTTIYYAENLGTIVDNLKEIKPQIMTSVPRLLEKIYDRIISKGRKLKGLQKGIFFWAVSLGLNYNHNRNIVYKLQLKLANALVFKKWREALGGKFRLIVSGGAAIQPRLARVFWAAKIPVLEGYGLTETSPVIAVSHFGKNGVRFDAVGPVLKGVDVNIADDGEILVKGPNVMQGYYKEPEKTKEVIDNEGWFHTGDIGMMKNNHLKITGRKKEVFKTSFGKYVSPQPIENKLKESPFIENAMVTGENQKFAAALISLDFDHLRSWCNIKGIEYTTNEEMIQMPRIRNRIKRDIDEFNQQFGETEQIKRFALIPRAWGMENKELTPTLKLKRDVISKNYHKEIQDIFRN
ncbi:MAG: long-chain fatty acid--CoA ligase [Bacteroidales bacterium]|nr:long-chain fatty acid--CoA ligase [Bacteroidales bacterium]